MSRKEHIDEFDDLGEWEGAFHVRNRWVEHEEPRRHEPGQQREKRARKGKARRQQSSHHAMG